LVGATAFLDPKAASQSSNINRLRDRETAKIAKHGVESAKLG